MTEIDAHLAASLARRFRLVRQLGAGGMGAVFLAEQITVGNRPVALKVLSRKLLDDPDFLLRFQNEAASTGRIHHANVVTIYESGQADDGTPYIAMEFLEGESLRQALARRGALPAPEVAEILQQAARGLNAAHKLGIIHRDLKPDNIFLTYPDDDNVARVSPPAQTVPPASPPAPVEGAIAPTGAPENLVVKLVDFGIAKLRESGAHTQTGMVLGTPAYMSFEQASGMRSDELDARSDVYSLGVVVYEMLTGRTPFHSDTPVGYLRMHMQEAPPPLRTVKPDLTTLPQLESVVMKALSKDRDQRYGSALEFARAFAEPADARKAVVGAVREPPLRDQGTIFESPVPPAAPPEPVQPAGKPQAEPTPGRPNRSRRNRLVVVGCLILLLLATAMGRWLWQGGGFTLERTLTGHQDAISSVAFSPGGKLLASGSVDKTVKLWDVASGSLKETLTGHAWYVWSVAFSPDGKLLASGSADNTVKLWDVDSGRLSQTLTGHSWAVQSVAFSPDGKLLASGSLDDTIRLWDVASGAPRQTFSGHGGNVYSVSFSPDGKLLASGGLDNTIRLWDVPTGKLKQTLTVDSTDIGSVAFSPKGELLASASMKDNTVRLFDVATWTVRQMLTGHTDFVRSVAFSPDGKLLASASWDKTVGIWEVASGRLKQTLTGYMGYVDSVAFSPDGKLLAFGGEDKTIKIWRVPE